MPLSMCRIQFQKPAGIRWYRSKEVTNVPTNDSQYSTINQFLDVLIRSQDVIISKSDVSRTRTPVVNNKTLHSKQILRLEKHPVSSRRLIIIAMVYKCCQSPSQEFGIYRRDRNVQTLHIGLKTIGDCMVGLHLLPHQRVYHGVLLEVCIIIMMIHGLVRIYIVLGCFMRFIF
jgi:hypothetical protein